jgi:KUP system potassium uptake protein
MDSMSKEELAPGSLAVSNAKVAIEEGQRPGRVDQAKPQHHKGNTWFLALTAIGIVYGDIGTSPLYAFSVALNATGHRPPFASDIIGIVSLTLWALLLMVSLKYVVLVLRADNDGEGGILALLALVASDKIADGTRLSVLVLLGVAGAAMLYGDGVITPAISVLSAMEGLKLASPAFAGFIVPVTLAILIALFAIQRREPRASAGFSGQSWSSGS